MGRPKKVITLTPHDVRELRLELARISFIDYCRLRAPDFYLEEREHLTTLCLELQDWLDGNIQLQIVNIAPRHGKSRTASLLTEWSFGRNQAIKAMIGTYNETLSETFSRAVRNGIQEERFDPDVIIYQDIFPGVAIEEGDGAVKRWTLAGQHASYLATSPGGTATGFGATLLIIDDLIKNAEEAYNENVLEKHWTWFTSTMLQRLESGAKILVIMTRWAKGDLCGRIIDDFKARHVPYRHLIMKAWDGTKMLCPGILSRAEYLAVTGPMDKAIAAANYDQDPIDQKGRLYTKFMTYKELPDPGTWSGVRSYCDTADEGTDFLCQLIYAIINREAYVLDVYYTRDPMEKTEPETAQRLFDFRVNNAKIESNNGGRGFARTIKRILAEILLSAYTRVSWFHQAKNKLARIRTNATWVMDHIYFPANWADRWPEYHRAMTSYQREGINKNDDGPDATTGVAEDMTTTGWGW